MWKGDPETGPLLPSSQLSVCSLSVWASLCWELCILLTGRQDPAWGWPCGVAWGRLHGSERACRTELPAAGSLCLALESGFIQIFSFRIWGCGSLRARMDWSFSLSPSRYLLIILTMATFAFGSHMPHGPLGGCADPVSPAFSTGLQFPPGRCSVSKRSRNFLKCNVCK